MQIAIDVFLAFGSLCLFYSALRGFDETPSRFGRAMAFLPANFTLRLVLAIVGARVLGDVLDKYGWPQLHNVTEAPQFQIFAGVATIVMFVLVGFALFAKRVQTKNM